ncbi:MAG: DUF2341 domain-containing protein [Ignavibacteria bacterium]|nr:DUF2341 domain-containing protein [Ignavibacteria bacterium]
MKKVLSSILLFSILLVFVFGVGAQYKYANPIRIKNNTSTTLTNVQVLIIFNTAIPIANGWMQPNGNDIRFTSTCGGSVFLNHFLEGYINTDTTKIWLKVPSIGPNDSTLVYLYYGNASATSASTLSVFDGPHSGCDSVVVTSTNTVSNCQRGFAFTPTEDVLIAYFGKRIPNVTQRYVTLFDATTQALLVQIQVDPGVAGQYNYNLLPTPFWARTGVQYIIALYNGSGDMYYYGTSSQIGQHMTYGNMRYRNTCTQNDFPNLTLTNYHYGTPDFLYFVKQNITPPPTVTILPAADTTTPAAPTNLTATAGSGSALLKWNKNTEFDMKEYRVFRNTVNNPATATQIGIVNHPDTTYNATGLTNGTTYYFWVKAVDRYCDPKISAFSNVASCTPGGGGAVVNRSIVLPTPGVNTNYVMIPYNPAMNWTSNQITIEAWVKIGGTTTANTVLNKGAASFDYQLGINASTANPFFRAQGTIVLGSSITIPANVWTHLAVVSNGSTVVFYVNGSPAQTVSTATTLGSSTNEMRIGRGNADPGSGKLDEVRLWSVARTASEIANNMCVKYIPNTTSGLKAIWHFDSTFVDSVSGFNGTAVGTVTFDTANNCMQTSIKNIQSEVPTEFYLSQNYPNPFNPNTSIKFSLPKDAYVELKIYDIMGREVATLISDPYKAGTYIVDFNAGHLASGIYFYKIVAGGFSDVKKMILLK